MVDAIDYIAWEETKQEIRETKVPVIHIDGGSRKRGTQACEAQALTGGYFIWQTEKSKALDMMTLEKVRMAGGGERRRQASQPRKEREGKQTTRQKEE